MREQKRNIIAILAISFLTLSMGAVNSALAGISAAFPDQPSTTISLLTTLPILFSIPSAILAGRIAGNQISYRKTVLISVAILLVAGVVPFFCESLTMILVFRAIFGIGLGGLSPIASTLSLNVLDKKTGERQLGLNIIASNLGAVLFQLLGGFLCGSSWKGCFLTYLLVLPAWIVIFVLLREPDKVGTEPTPSAAMDASAPQDGEEQPSSGRMVFWLTISGVFAILYYTMITGLSMLIELENLGTAADTGIALSMFTVGGIIGGFLSSSLIGKLQRKMLILSGCFCTVGFFLQGYGTSLLVIEAGTLLFGIGLGTFMPVSLAECGRSCRARDRALVIAAFNAISNLGSFLSAFLFAGIGAALHLTGCRYSIRISAGAFAVMTAVFAVYALRSSEGRKPSGRPGR